MDLERRKKIAKIFVGIGTLFLIIGFIPGLITYKSGLIFFVFSLALGGIVLIAPRNPDPPHEKFDPNRDEPPGSEEKDLKFPWEF